ncbi:MAG: DUF2029 domain-containing protein [Methylotenera sp.]|nr:DUF2029 domain-containing protein [Oligoflexia bacterium]
MKYKKAVMVLAATAALITVPLYAVKIAKRTDYSDFEVYYRTAMRAQAQDWANVYNPQIDGNCPFRYAPSAIPLFMPFTWLPLQTAKVIWFLIQASFFVLGFLGLFRVARTWCSREDSVWMISLTFLFVLRFCLDSFTIGQISGLMFACFAWSLLFFVRGQAKSSSSWLVLPFFLKVAPGFLFGVSLSSPVRFFRTYLCTVLAGVGAVMAVSVLWLRDLTVATTLWKSWLHIVVSDSSYFDNSHYGSQSINSALLRFSRWSGLLSPASVSHLWMLLVLSGSLSIATFWAMRRPVSNRGILLFYSLGILAYLLFMPATFKYSQPFLAIPMLGLLSGTGTLDRFTRFAIVFAFLTLSLAGLDVIGSTLFFAFQKASIPVLAMILLGVAVLRESLKESEAKSKLIQVAS